MAKERTQKTRTLNTRTKEQKDAYHNTLNAGINYLTAQSLGDTSELSTQAKTFNQYAINQGVDPERDLNGLPRHVELYAKIIPETQKREKESLIKTVTDNFKYLVDQLPADILLQTAVQLGRTDAEKELEKILTEFPDKTDDVKKAFSELYEPSALIQSYIALNTNPAEIAQCATGALQRSYTRRAAEFQHAKDGKPVILKRKLLPYVTEQITEVSEEDKNEAMLLIGSSLARKKILKEQEKAEQTENQSK